MKRRRVDILECSSCGGCHGAYLLTQEGSCWYYCTVTEDAVPVSIEPVLSA